MILSVGIILTPWDWNIGFEMDEQVSVLVLGPFVLVLENIEYE
jgi:hypothetical protein